MHVARIDPSRTILKIVSQMLQAGGHTVLAFTDSGAALAHVEAAPAVACVLTSLEVEPIGGLERCGSLRAIAGERRPLTIPVMSPHATTGPSARPSTAAPTTSWQKPPRPQELYGRLRSAERVPKRSTTRPCASWVSRMRAPSAPRAALTLPPGLDSHGVRACPSGSPGSAVSEAATSRVGA